METHGLSWCRIMTLCVAGGMAAVVIAFGQARAPQAQAAGQTTVAQEKLPAFDVASIKQNKSALSDYLLVFNSSGVNIENLSLLSIIREAYGIPNYPDDRFIGIPGWAITEKFDIEAKVDDAHLAELKKLSLDKRKLMLQALLADRFKLRAHHETRELPIYELVISQDGPKLQVSPPSPVPSDLKMDRGRITGQKIGMYRLETTLEQVLSRTVVDKTGLRGLYDFTLSWSPDEAAAPLAQNRNGAAQGQAASGPSIFTAIEEQLGLKLTPTEGPLEVLVIDHVEQPSAN
jgi:uncharacterized protein (TIGR03435 family)